MVSVGHLEKPTWYAEMMSPFEAAWAEIQSRRPQGQYMGGSTGALGFDLEPGRFVAKRGNHPQHILNTT